MSHDVDLALQHFSQFHLNYCLLFPEIIISNANIKIPVKSDSFQHEYKDPN